MAHCFSRVPTCTFGALALVCVLPGCRHAAPAAHEEVHPAPVHVAEAKAETWGEWTELLGSTLPLLDRVARVTAPVEGRVLSILTQDDGTALVEGQHVQAGQVIARLDDRIIRANRAKTEASLRELEQQEKQAEYAIELAQIEVDRLENLTRNGSAGGSRTPLVSQIELNKARVALKEAESKQDAAAARHAVNDAEIRALDVQLDLYSLRAPIAGRLGMVQVVTGQTLAVGANVADVLDLDDIDVLAFVPPHATAHLALDQPARLVPNSVHAAADPPEATGKVVFIAMQAQPDTGNFAVKLRFPNHELQHRANAVVRVQVLTEPERERWTIPASALMEDREPPSVVVVEDVKTETASDGKEEKRGTAHRLDAVPGARDRAQQRVELRELKDPETHESVPIEEALFIIEGGHGLEEDDPVKLAADEEGEGD